jgi:hypothetical protein
MSTDAPIRQDEMSPYRRDPIEVLFHYGFRDDADETPAPHAVLIDRLQHGTAGNPAKVVTDRRQAKPPDINPVLAVEAAAKLIVRKTVRGVIAL